ncbi:MAG: hypothetical protein JXA54_07445 [Candidatus Heimdallarchaeota archaeon]|nr:hypothetical protein [Candidatus Heimdallarchaeota archaeon]
MDEEYEEIMPQEKFTTRRKIFLGIGAFCLIAIILIVIFTMYFVAHNPPIEMI